MKPTRVVFLVYPNVTQLDLTGPAQVLSRLPDAKVDLVWKNRDPVQTDSGFALLPTATLDEVGEAEILCVPGGFGCVDVMLDDEALGWVKSVGDGAQWVTSVCTGSLILGAAGLLLAALGVYGVVGFMVAMRTREMAVRIALGATNRRVLRTILTDVVMLVTPGVAFGLIVAVAVVRMSFLSFYSLGGVEPLVYTAGAAIAVCVALLAGLPSARRAASVEPMIAIRSE